MDQIFQQLHNGSYHDKEPPKVPRYQIYSAHDYNLVHFLKQLVPEFDYDYIKYASVFTIEMRVNHNCWQARTFVRNFDQCIKVRMAFNNKYLDPKTKDLIPYQSDTPAKEPPIKCNLLKTTYCLPPKDGEPTEADEDA